MAAVANHHQAVSVPSRSNPNRGIESTRGASMSTSANMAPAPAPAPAPASAAKKGKAKKEPDPSESRKLLEAKIAQLEQDQAGDKEQELEIGGSTPALDVRHWEGCADCCGGSGNIRGGWFLLCECRHDAAPLHPSCLSSRFYCLCKANDVQSAK
jgi:hypothetical protein